MLKLAVVHKAGPRSSLRDFAILMRRRGHAPLVSDVPLDERAVSPQEREHVQAQLESHGIELLDFLTALGIFEIVLLCRAASIEIVADVLGELADDWHTDALLATSHLRYEPASDFTPPTVYRSR
jgi:hypothetical protein